ncbi:hypothetical protein AC249_AIPGENE289 [Exaiptasia diaphana]|nr:hypothetical protein AC249_AIPGENE289 [Exaiptasia diaphana]
MRSRAHTYLAHYEELHNKMCPVSARLEVVLLFEDRILPLLNANRLLSEGRILSLLQTFPVLVPFKESVQDLPWTFLQSMSSVVSHLTSTLRTLFQENVALEGFDATWKSYQYELALEYFFHGRPLTISDCRMASILGVNPSQRETLTYNRGFLGLLPYVSASDGKSPPPLTNWTLSDVEQRRLTRVFIFSTQLDQSPQAVEPYPFLSYRATPKAPDMFRETKLRLQLVYTHLVFKAAKESHFDNLADYVRASTVSNAHFVIQARDQWRILKKALKDPSLPKNIWDEDPMAKKHELKNFNMLRCSMPVVDDDSDDDVPLSCLKRKKARKVINDDDDDDMDDEHERVEEGDTKGLEDQQQPLAGATAPTASVSTQIFQANPLLVAQPPPVVAAVQSPQPPPVVAAQPPAAQPPPELPQPQLPQPQLPVPVSAAPLPVPGPVAVPGPLLSALLSSGDANPAPQLPRPSTSMDETERLVAAAKPPPLAKDRNRVQLCNVAVPNMWKGSSEPWAPLAVPHYEPCLGKMPWLLTMMASSVVAKPSDEMTQSDHDDLDDVITDAEEDNDGDYNESNDEEEEVSVATAQPPRRKRSSFVLPDIKIPRLTPYKESLAAFHQHLQLSHGGNKSEEAARADVAKVHLMGSHAVPVHTGALLEVWGNEMLIWTQFFDHGLQTNRRKGTALKTYSVALQKYLEFLVGRRVTDPRYERVSQECVIPRELDHWPTLRWGSLRLDGLTRYQPVRVIFTLSSFSSYHITCQSFVPRLHNHL